MKQGVDEPQTLEELIAATLVPKVVEAIEQMELVPTEFTDKNPGPLIAMTLHRNGDIGIQINASVPTAKVMTIFVGVIALSGGIAGLVQVI